MTTYVCFFQNFTALWCELLLSTQWVLKLTGHVPAHWECFFCDFWYKRWLGFHQREKHPIYRIRVYCEQIIMKSILFTPNWMCVIVYEIGMLIMGGKWGWKHVSQEKVKISKSGRHIHHNIFEVPSPWTQITILRALSMSGPVGKGIVKNTYRYLE